MKEMKLRHSKIVETIWKKNNETNSKMEAEKKLMLGNKTEFISKLESNHSIVLENLRHKHNDTIN